MSIYGTCLRTCTLLATHTSLGSKIIIPPPPPTEYLLFLQSRGLPSAFPTPSLLFFLRYSGRLTSLVGFAIAWSLTVILSHYINCSTIVISSSTNMYSRLVMIERAVADGIGRVLWTHWDKNFHKRHITFFIWHPDQSHVCASSIVSRTYSRRSSILIISQRDEGGNGFVLKIFIHHENAHQA